MAATCEQMLKKLHTMLSPHGIALPDDTELRRAYAGSLQRNEGAWSWFAFSPSTPRSLGPAGRDIGSHYPMNVLLRCQNVTVNFTTFGIHLDPCEECISRYGRVRF